MLVIGYQIRAGMLAGTPGGEGVGSQAGLSGWYSDQALVAEDEALRAGVAEASAAEVLAPRVRDRGRGRVGVRVRIRAWVRVRVWG